MSETLSGDALLRALLAIAEEHLRWQQAATLPTVREALVSTLSTSEMRMVYEMCDGQRTFRDIAASAGVSLSTVSSWTRRWRDAALIYETESGRMKQLVSLEAIGLSTEVDGVDTLQRSRKR